jgi:hypothetical protein
MPELILNLHMHTIYSDGSGTHQTLAEAAAANGVDVIITTDHNVLVQEMEGYYQGKPAGAKGSKQAGPKPGRVLVLVGEEVHDRTRQPQKSHLLVIGAGREMAALANKPQVLVDQVIKANGLAFIAHPNDPELKAFNEVDISWEDWDVRGYTGIELWNGFSELKSVMRSKLDGLFYAYFPRYMARGPLPATLKKWDELLAKGQKVVAVGGSDAHALHMRLGPLRRTVFPYEYHFQAVNTHLLVNRELGNDLAADRQLVLDALRMGHAFVGYDLPAPTRGFRFTAQGKAGTAVMGDEIRLNSGVTFQIRVPAKTECRLILSGEVIKTWRDREICTHIASQPGAYRVECSIPYLGRQRGWIYSNPIYVKE